MAGQVAKKYGIAGLRLTVGNSTFSATKFIRDVGARAVCLSFDANRDMEMPNGRLDPHHL
jgi:hypothetical protein